MDGIQAYPGPHGPALPPHPYGPASSNAVVKGPADYFRAVRRQLWLVLTVAVFISVLGSLLVLRMKPVYRTKSDITIKPPEYDAILSQIVARESLYRTDKEAQERYVPDRVTYLRSKGLAMQVLRDPSISGPNPGSIDEAADELVENLKSRNFVGTSAYEITLEGGDPAKITRTLRLLLEKFRQISQDESKDLFVNSRTEAMSSLKRYTEELETKDKQIYELLSGSLAIAPGGKSILQDQYDNIASAIMQKKVHLEDLQRQLQLEANRPQATTESAAAMARAAQYEKYAEEERMLYNRLQYNKRLVRSQDDPTLQDLKTRIQYIRTRMERLKEVTEEVTAAPDPGDLVLASAREEIESYEGKSRDLLHKLQESVPDHNRYITLTKERDAKAAQISELQTKLSQFEVLDKTQKPPVEINLVAAEPLTPIRPKKALSIAMCVAFGLFLGIGLACFREYLDQSVKVPEHLTAGLTMPLLGVIPRIRRTSLNHRGGHLWTPGAPDSIAADAYRNLRASLLGVARTKGPIVTLLVTSAKAGEGKSTTALNLAATCARAGERTLLVDIDLRRPSLLDVFPHEDNHLGLVDVLRGEMPWQQILVPTDLPNLDFLPTGDTRNVPIEILGSLELRQLLLSLSTNHYDRVILDGPAVLGLADCRMLGQIVDAAMFVVRCGSVELRPLKRAKAMLEQSQVPLAGLVFNGLADDLDNWSSYGPGPSSPEGISATRGSSVPATRLEASSADSAHALTGRA